MSFTTIRKKLGKRYCMYNFRHSWATAALQNGVDPITVAVLMGHHHLDVHLERGEGDFFILGEWFSKFTCVRLRDGEFSLLRWPLDK